MLRFCLLITKFWSYSASWLGKSKRYRWLSLSANTRTALLNSLGRFCTFMGRKVLPVCYLILWISSLRFKGVLVSVGLIINSSSNSYLMAALLIFKAKNWLLGRFVKCLTICWLIWCISSPIASWWALLEFMSRSERPEAELLHSVPQFPMVLKLKISIIIDG